MTGGEELLTLAEAAQVLGVHYMTAYRYVRTGRLPAAKRGGTWVVGSGDLEEFSRGDTSTTASGTSGGSAAGPAPTAGDRRRTGGPGSRRSSTYAARLEDRLIHGDEQGAWGVVEEALGSSMTPELVYTSVVGPAMASIGERWARHELAIEDEHLASTTVHRLAGRLGPRFTRRGRHRGTIVVGAPAGDAHGIPVMLMADLLRGRGFDVVDLGANTPPGAFGRAAAGVDRLVAVGICATLTGNDAAIAEAVAAIAEHADSPVVLGGRGVNHETDAVIARRLGGVAPRVRRTGDSEAAVACFEEAAAAPV